MEFQFRKTPKDQDHIDSIEDEEPQQMEPEYLEEQESQTKDTTSVYGGQKEFEMECEKQSETNRSNPVLVIRIPLQGELDLGFLNNRGLGGAGGAPLEIHFQEEGKITHLKNVPNSIQILECPNQELKSIDPLPDALVRLNITNNQIESLDLGKTQKLKYLYANKNRLHTVSNIPPSLEEIHVLQNPNLTLLDLEDPSLISKSLKILETDPHVILKNVEYESLQHSMENDQEGGGPKKKKEDSTSQKKKPTIKYQDALNKYFEYKKLYEKSVAKFKLGQEKETKKKQDKMPKCIRCKQPVGMTFKKDGNFYIAKCGQAKTYNCDFKIELNTGESSFLIQDLNDLNEEIQRNQTTLTKIKMDNLFGYEKDQDTMKRFKKQIQDFNDNNEFMEILLEKYREIFNENVEKQHQIEKLEKEFVEQKMKYQEFLEAYQKDPLNRTLLDDAMEFYTTKIRPTRLSLQKLIYPTMEMNILPPRKEYGFIGKLMDPYELYYSHIVPANYYTYETKKPEVLIYQEGP